MRDDTQLTQEERYQIEALLKGGHSQSVITSVLRSHKFKISRKFRRNRGLRGCRPKQVQRLALARRTAKISPRIAPGTWERVRGLLCEEWSRSRSAVGCRRRRARGKNESYCLTSHLPSTGLNSKTFSVSPTYASPLLLRDAQQGLALFPKSG